MKVKVKKLHPDAVIPSYAKPGDAGMDLVAVSRNIDEHGNFVYGTGLAFEIPKGYVGLVFPRSSVSKYNLQLTNNVGVIDSGYRGEVTAKFKGSFSVFRKDLNGEGAYTLYKGSVYDIGERIAQMIIIPYPQIEFEEIDDLSETERGCGSYGSTGR